MKKELINKILIIIVTAILSSALTYLTIKLVKNNKEDSFVNSYNNATKKVGVIKAEKYDYKLPAFSISVLGNKFDSITSKDLEKTPVTRFIAVVSNGKNKIVRKYTGIKFKDVLNTKNFNEYSSITFKSTGGLQVTYDKSQITDEVFLIFQVNDKGFIKNEKVGLLAVDRLSRYSIPNIVRIDIN
ncbi:MAG: hypothetical protein RR228_00775 [Bacilli bacterium]